MEFAGIPSDELPEVLATGQSDVSFAFISLSARDGQGRDAEYIEWHTLDHRPEQYRLTGMRNALRLVSTPTCRAARAASTDRFDDVDHVMTYLFTGLAAMPPFSALGGALHRGGRMPHVLPQVMHLTGDLVGKTAAARVVAGADAMPWRPCTGVYLVIERGEVAPPIAEDLPGVAGAWWYAGRLAPAPFTQDGRGLCITYYYLDGDPLEVAGPLGERFRQRWSKGSAQGLLAAPFYATIPFEWDRYLP